MDDLSINFSRGAFNPGGSNANAEDIRAAQPGAVIVFEPIWRPHVGVWSTRGIFTLSLQGTWIPLVGHECNRTMDEMAYDAGEFDLYLKRAPVAVTA